MVLVVSKRNATGVLLAKVTKAEEGTSKSSGKPQAVFGLTVIQAPNPKDVGTSFNYISFSPSTPFGETQLTNFVGVLLNQDIPLGTQITLYEEGEELPENAPNPVEFGDLLNRTVTVRMEDRTYNGQTFPDMKEFWPEGQYEAMVAKYQGSF